ncbi:DUF1214 domain-containing protein [Pseudovibrio sp. SPO723]|uniref:DUF1214 domain-containing protein n=1 Tax=Nesiotobacter zosterae TaxID=392721 RepID=UPI0029C1D450|nr:DUF1214 domain-containing protein [Pseudovibrio sp. SPO723]MDX5595600.1 DUF1214 domain-containing protein [Pseudovibrio sp. SPO723]
MPSLALLKQPQEPFYDPETSWQKPWPRVSRLLYRTSLFSFGPFVLFLLVTIVFGVGSAYMALTKSSPFEALQSGVWVAHPKAGTDAADPYSAAIFARTLRIPLGSGEGLAFYAVVDDRGRLLNPSCTYTIAGKTPPARVWTLTAVNQQLELLATDAGRSYLNSENLLRDKDGSFEITASQDARPGNWLPTGSAGGLVFALRLYDTPLTTGAGIAGPQMPSIRRGDCQ